jgi:hypothetical protein
LQNGISVVQKAQNQLIKIKIFRTGLPVQTKFSGTEFSAKIFLFTIRTSLKSDDFKRTFALVTQKIFEFFAIYTPFWEQKI